jgi:hypothetical protein
MSNPEKPKDAQKPPVEGPTQAFRLKVGEWFDEIKDDFGPAATPPKEGAPTAEAPPKAKDSAKAPPPPPARKPPVPR